MGNGGLAFPHPVLGNGDDIAVGQVEPEIVYQANVEDVDLTVSGLKTGNPTLDDLIAKRQAHWSVRIQCARTYFRRELTTRDQRVAFRLDGSDLDGRIDVDVTLVAATAVSGYRPVGVHDDFGSTAFDIGPGDVLAVGPSFNFLIDKQFDPLRAPVSSFMRIGPGEEEIGPFRIDYDADLLTILLSKKDWDLYGLIKVRAPGVVHIGLVLPVLASALGKISAGVEDYRGKRWWDRLSAIVQEKGLDLSDPLKTAQELLQNPVTRAFGELHSRFDNLDTEA